MNNIREQYENDGFLIHPQSVLAPDLVERAARGLDAVRDGVYETGEAPDERFWNPGDDPHALCKLEQPQLCNYALREAIASSELGRVAGEITGASRVQVWWVQLLYKPGAPAATERNSKVGWHQDKFYWDAWEEGSGLLTAWLALSDVTPESGPMIFVPGSQSWGLDEGGNFFSQNQGELRAKIKIPAGQSWREVPDILPAGGVSFHHQLVFHGSHDNTSNQPRRSLAIHLCLDDAKVKPATWAGRYLDRPEICPTIFRR